MFDFHALNFDMDGDGNPDYYAEGIDTDGDGIVDSIALDMDGDGIADFFALDYDGDGNYDEGYHDFDNDGTPDIIFSDTDDDGRPDSYVIQVDSDKDGVVDIIQKYYDYNQDGNPDSVTTYQDLNNDGIFDVISKAYDSSGDGSMDTLKTYFDYDGDGKPDAISEEQFLDTDGDGKIDTYLNRIDEDGDHAFEVAEVYDYDESTGTLELVSMDASAGNVSGAYVDDLTNFDPGKVDPEDITGNPARSMEAWEFQGDTGRCALYSQKFVIEELAGKEIDMEELADLAEENDWFSEEGGTTFLNMNKVLDYYGIDNQMTFHNDFNDIKDCLESGGKVIVSIDADEIWYGESDDLFTPADGANHAVEVIGIDNSNPNEPMVILNDSGNPNGCGEMVPLDTFLDAWEDGNCQMISCM